MYSYEYCKVQLNNTALGFCDQLEAFRRALGLLQCIPDKAFGKKIFFSLGDIPESEFRALEGTLTGAFI